MVHFAPVNPETLFLYDPVTDKSQEIYPRKNDPFRKNFSERLGEIIDEKRCQDNNWPCDPSDFESRIAPIEVNDATRSLAFRVEFGTEGLLTRGEDEDSGKWDDDEYVYIYQLRPPRWREFSIYDLKPKFGTASLKGLLARQRNCAKYLQLLLPSNGRSFVQFAAGVSAPAACPPTCRIEDSRLRLCFFLPLHTA